MSERVSKPLIQWRDEFNVGVPDVDAEHRELVELINALPGALERDSTNTVVEMMGEIYARISGHFALEERLMRQSRYDRYAEHTTDHEALLDELRDLMDDFEAGEWIDLEAFANRVGEWFAGHFRTHDARLHHRLHA